MTKANKISFVAIIGLILASLLFLLSSVLTGTKNAGASAPSGLFATIATSSQLTVGTTAGLAFATSTAGCSSRIVSTTGKAVMMTLSQYKGETPSATIGFLQGASTTVAYDAGLYGCGRMDIYGFDSNTTVNVAEFR